MRKLQVIVLSGCDVSHHVIVGGLTQTDTQPDLIRES